MRYVIETGGQGLITRLYMTERGVFCGDVEKAAEFEWWDDADTRAAELAGKYPQLMFWTSEVP